jgi:hypothetical protein
MATGSETEVLRSDGAIRRRDVEFQTDDGLTLRGWLYLPASATTALPAVVVTQGFGGVKEQYVDDVAETIAGNGLAVLLYDHRNFGTSDGEPRQEADPWAQIRDYRTAITYLETLPEVDPDRIGVFGSSYAGGHAIVVTALDRRVKCVFVQVPIISGYRNGVRFVRSDMVADLRARFDADRRARFAGEAPETVPMIARDPAADAALPNVEVYDWYQTIEPWRLENWRNEVTLRSIEMWWEYEPGAYIDRMSPTPMLMVIGAQDALTVSEEAFAAYERAREPKRLVTLPTGHFGVYVEYKEYCEQLAADWFAEHLLGEREPIVSP